ncbi:MAG: type II toxin-antitoxin system HicA family toxin [Thermodesulfobacteriota bacterium]
MPRLVPVHWRELEKIVLRLGLKFARQKGSHRSYVRSGLSRPVIIPVRSDIPVSIIRNIMDTLGISREEYFRLLQD